MARVNACCIVHHNLGSSSGFALFGVRVMHLPGDMKHVVGFVTFRASCLVVGSTPEVTQEEHAAGEATSDVIQSDSSSARKQQSQRDREQQYAQLLSGQRREDAQALLSQVCLPNSWALHSWCEVKLLCELGGLHGMQSRTAIRAISNKLPDEQAGYGLSGCGVMTCL